MDVQLKAWSRRLEPPDYTGLGMSVIVLRACPVVNPRLSASSPG
jgi:hypothetical protein